MSTDQISTDQPTGSPAIVTALIPSERAIEGDGFVVRRPFPTESLSHLDPFLLFDHFGPVTFAPGTGTGTPWHPHRGFETVSYFLEGESEHRDSMGNRGFMRAGDTQWMTAGSGILHKEGPSAAEQAAGGTSHGLQLWVNLPAAKKMIDPAYQDLRADDVPRTEVDGAAVRVIAGELFGLRGPGSTHTPISYAHVTVHEGATVTTSLPDGHVVLVYPMTGGVTIAGAEVGEGVMAVVEGAELSISGTAASSEVIVLTGLPIGEPVARSGPFVMNTQGELRQAMLDFNDGRFGHPTD